MLVWHHVEPLDVIMPEPDYITVANSGWKTRPECHNTLAQRRSERVCETPTRSRKPDGNRRSLRCLRDSCRRWRYARTIVRSSIVAMHFRPNQAEPLQV